ncbi:MAG: vanadium-dependent haloperoxidase [Phycisphaerales bacterium]
MHIAGSLAAVRWSLATLAVFASCGVASARIGSDPPSVARQWNEELLEAIRDAFARPTVHARNLFHLSVEMWDAWAAYDPDAQGWLFTEKHGAKKPDSARDEAISYASYRLLRHRFFASPGAVETLPRLLERMVWLGYDPTFTSTQGNSPAAIGNRIAAAIIAFGLDDGSNEWDDYQIPEGTYVPANPPLIVEDPGNPTLVDPNRWQPLTLETFVDQSGNTIPGGTPPFLTPFWGFVVPFALRPEDMNPDRPGVYLDPGPPPRHGGPGHDEYRSGMEQVAEWSGWHDPDDGVVWDISPASMGNNPLGTNGGTGYDVNPVTGTPYTPQLVPRGDYVRVLAEFWADGPDSEAPPGHWNVVANYVSDEIAEKRLGGTGPLLDDLEWDVKLYLALNGGMHDAAICGWGIKGHYDGIRPISAIRYLAQLGQCTSPALPSYNPLGIDLKPGAIELITAESSAPGQRHAHLASHVGEIAVFAWKGAPEFPEFQYSGAAWILAANWVPYQRPSFVSPPFAGYVSGHSTYSRTAAEILHRFTGSAWFPNGLGEFHCEANQYLVFEDGPSIDITLQWASYYDAADESGISRIYGGIHPRWDDLPGRLLGAELGPRAFEHAVTYFGLPKVPCPADLNDDGVVNGVDLGVALASWGPCKKGCPADIDGDGDVDGADLAIVLSGWGSCN